VHGSGDDNVHFQGTQKLANRLIELGKPFDFNGVSEPHALYLEGQRNDVARIQSDRPLYRRAPVGQASWPV